MCVGLCTLFNLAPKVEHQLEVGMFALLNDTTTVVDTTTRSSTDKHVAVLITGPNESEGEMMMDIGVSKTLLTDERIAFWAVLIGVLASNFGK